MTCRVEDPKLALEYRWSLPGSVARFEELRSGLSNVLSGKCDQQLRCEAFLWMDHSSAWFNANMTCRVEDPSLARDYCWSLPGSVARFEELRSGLFSVLPGIGGPQSRCISFLIATLCSF